MTQLPLTFEAPLARSRDPLTSHQAADRAVRFAASHEGCIYAALLECGERGGTIAELERVTRLDKVQCARRLAAMERRGTVTRRRVDWAMRRGVAVEVYEARGGFTVWRACE